MSAINSGFHQDKTSQEYKIREKPRFRNSEGADPSDDRNKPQPPERPNHPTVYV